jgi:G3E family GTPase
VDALRDLAARRDGGRIAPFQWIVIETSGVADPAPVLHAIMADHELALRYRVAGVVTLVDAVNGLATLQHNTESMRQVAVADTLALAKSDLLDRTGRRAELASLTASLRALNPAAPIVDIAAGEFCAVDLIALDFFDSAILSSVDIPSATFHSASIGAYSLRLAEPVEAPAFSLFLDLLRAALGPRLLRVKGLVALAEHPAEPLVIQGVQHIFHVPRRLKAWPDEARSTRIVLVVDGIDRAIVDRLWAALSSAPQVDGPDLAALAQSSLSAARGLLA